MKKGICWGCIPGDHPTRPSRAGTPEPPTLDVRLRAAKEAGFQGVEPTVSDPGAGPLTLETTEREAEGMRGTAEKMGVELPSVMCGVAVGKNPVISPDAAVRKQAVENLGRVLERAKWLGATAVLLHPGQLRPETRYDDAWRWVQEALEQAGEDAGKNHVTLAIENVWNKFLLSPTEMKQMID